MKHITKTHLISSISLLVVLSLLFVASCKKEPINPDEPNNEDPLNLGFDPALTPEELQVLEDASVNYDDFLDSLFDINGVSYRTIFSDPNWNNKMDSLKALLRTNQISVSHQIKVDINNMLLFGGGLVNENRIAANIRPQLSSEEPAQQAYAYLQVPANERQINTRVRPVFGNEIYKQYKLLGVDCSGYLYFLFRSAGFPNANFTFSQGTFQTKIPNSVSQKYSNNAELINLGNLEASKLKKGDFMVWSGHGAIIDKAGVNPLAYQSNGTAFPPNEANHRTNFEFSGPQVKRGISVKDYNWLNTWVGQSISIYRIVPIIDKGEIHSGNNQEGSENQNLSQPLKIKVLDKTGYGIEDVLVVFSVKSGGGQIEGEQEVKTNEEGIAQATWKLGTQNAGAQEVEVKIKKFTGGFIEQTPIKFSATFGGGCGDISTVTDIDGNEYPVVQIGEQCWMAENLKTSKYADGSPIPNVTSNDAWAALGSGAWSNYNSSAATGEVYGKLYNWYAVADPRNVCPDGWHAPSDAEWQQLELSLGMSAAEVGQTGMRGSSANVGGQMKATGLWNSPNTGATNSSGFSGLPGGYRDYSDGQFYNLGGTGGWWSATESSSANAWRRRLNYDSAGSSRRSLNKRNGYSVRCVRD